MDYRLDASASGEGASEELAMGVLREASNVFGAWRLYHEWSLVDVLPEADEERLNRLDATNMANLADRLADLVQTACELAAHYRIDLEDRMGDREELS